MRLGRRTADGGAMTTTESITTENITHVHTAEAATPPGAGRRTALAGCAFLTCALPLVFGTTITGMLLTGVDSDHRFHQTTGQGLILVAFWLGAVVPLLRAGWRGERPSTAAGLRHLTLVVAGAGCAVAAPGGGAPGLVGVIAVGGALLWCALPRRPRLRSAVQVDALLLPAALVLGAALLPYAADQLALQNDATGYHSRNPHFFDMAWISVVLVSQALMAALLPAARRLALPVAAATAALGAAGLAFGEDVTSSWVTVALGIVLAAAGLVGARRPLGA